MTIAIRTLLAGLFLLSINSLYAAEPKFSLTPLTPTNFFIANDEVVNVIYRVSNHTGITRTLTMVPIKGITQTTLGSGLCTNPFVLSPSESCLLSLSLIGSELPQVISTGPEICKTHFGSNTPDPFLCSRPSFSNSLKVTRVNATQPILFVQPSFLSLEPNGVSKSFTVTNASSLITARGIKAILEGTTLKDNVTQDASQCVEVPPGQTCTITFTPGTNAVSLTSFPIKGINTRPVGAAIVVAAPDTFAPIRVTGSPLILGPNGVGIITVTNTSQSLSATNVQAHSVPSGITQDASNCTTAAVPPGGTCTLSFTAGPVGVSPTRVLVYGSDTSITQALLSVSASPLLEMAFVGDSSLTLTADGTTTGTMTIQNTSGQFIDAGVTAHFEGTALNGHVSATTCGALNSGGTCIITFTAGRTSVPTATSFPIYKEDTTVALVGTITINQSPIAYLTSAVSNNLYQCVIESNSGNFTQCETFANLGLVAPRGIVINPAQTRVYIVNNGNASVSQCDIEPDTFHITNCQNANANDLSDPIGITINPAGTDAYITNHGNNTVSRCPINGSGNFSSSCINSGAAAVNKPTDIAIKADDSFAYISNINDAQITQCAVVSNNLSSCVAVYNGANLEQFNGITISTIKNMLYSSDQNLTSLLTCTLVDGGGLGSCLLKSMYPTVYRSAGVAVNLLGTIEYVANTDQNYYAQCPLDGDGVAQSCSQVSTTPGFLWGIALLESP